MADIKHVVVVVLENRSFDEYFGTFPGANGFFESSPAIPQKWPGQPNNKLYPFRASTFTSDAMSAPSLGHDWNSMHTAAGLDSPSTLVSGVWQNEELSATADNSGFEAATDDTKAMCYYAQNDIPYHWALARTFALCDNYFCSALSQTYPNRLYMTSGTIIDPLAIPIDNVLTYSLETANWVQDKGGPTPPADQRGPIIGNLGGSTYNSDPSNPQLMTPQVAWTQVPWGSYLSDLRNSSGWSDSSPLYTVYDDWNWMPPWTSNAVNLYSVAGGFKNNDLNVFSYYDDNLGVRGDPNYKETISSPQFQPDVLLQFEQDAANNALAPISWLFPPYCLSEHPPFTSADGGYYLSRIIDAVMNNAELWLQTVIIITYDETDTHFDHVPPTVSPDPRAAANPNGLTGPYEPWVSDVGGTNTVAFPAPAPIGAGMRVPAIIVSPWTYKVGAIHDLMDHTSVLRLMESVTGVEASHLPLQTEAPNLGWRRFTFSDLHQVIQDLGGAPVPADQVDRTQETGLPKQDTALAWQQKAWNRLSGIGIPPPAGTSDPNAPQAPSPPIWPPVPQACQLILPVASFTLDQVTALPETAGAHIISQAIQVIVQGFEPTEFFIGDDLALNPTSQIKITNSSEPCTTRIPSFSFTDVNGDLVPGIAAVNPTIDYDPSHTSTASGVPSEPRTFTFDLSLTASDLRALFPPPLPPQGATPNVIFVQANFSIDTTVISSAEIELLAADDPQFYHDFTNDTVYLSGELRVFSMPAGNKLFGVNLANSGDQQKDALEFISSLIGTMNHAQRSGTALRTTTFPIGTQNKVASFDDLNQLEDQNELSLSVSQPGATPTLNFALARVKMRAQQPASNVRVFFRCCRAAVTTSAYDAGSNNTHAAFYRNNPATAMGSAPLGTKVPLLGLLPVLQPDGTTPNEYVTIPFFATKRISLDFTNPLTTMKNQPADTPNVVKIPKSSGDEVVETFFGCWLDINQSEALFPVKAPNETSQWDGPWDPNDASNPVLTIQQAFLRDLHQCLVAEISYDPIIIPPDDIPSTSPYLAQRNLGFTQ